MNTEQIAAVAKSILRPRLGLMGLDHVEVTAGYDHDGDPALFVTGYYQPGTGVPSGEVLSSSHGALHEALQEKGEERFPYLNHRFGNDEGFEDDDLQDFKGGVPGA
jgi:hypothetical protein